MIVSSADFLFRNFFDQLRQLEGVELDLEQYHLFMKLFIKGYARKDDELLLLCKTLWLTKREHEQRFNALFEEHLNNLEKYWRLNLGITELTEKSFQESIESEKSSSSPSPQSPAPGKKPAQNVEGAKGAPSAPKNQSSVLDLTEIVLNFEEGSDEATNVGLDTAERGSEKGTTFIFSDEKHLPVTYRRMGHTLQKLKMNWQYRNGEALDIAEITREFGRTKTINELLFQREGFSHQKVILLTDHGGPMCAFEYWGDFLHQSLLDAPSVSNVTRYYFHRYPGLNQQSDGEDTFKFFANQSHTASLPLDKLLARADQNTWLIIFSQAGIYHSEANNETLQYWWLCLNTIRRHIPAITWLNPLPAERWEGTIAKSLELIVKMVPFNSNGLSKAVKWANYANRNRTA